ncbi:Hypothetical protein Yqai [Schinkia azotoformans MEV2011]|uniref:YqaI-like protein n=1 Tax=Schinkia azotoformans MEV2011 TaxID=1348973 RepID=A0A072NR69_SCHAZ|nr:hypothetical protein [Schinkia azotoformans]KEF40154.1 Hypothetical protein Yqai [Schinkia azotoformans MEV2011]
MPDIEHPTISRTLKTGYPNMVVQPEHFGIDYFGDEILTGDDYVEDPDNGEIVLKENLERYLSDVYGFEFKTAE